ncbi:MAG: sulfite exporter TauE/SafE family protein [Burkholderiaceae bacterium]
MIDPPASATTSGRARRGRPGLSFVACAAVGCLGGLIGLGGAEFRLPLLVALFAYATREAIGLNVALSLVTVVFSLVFRLAAGGEGALWQYATAIVTLAAGTIAGAFTGVAIGRMLSAAALSWVVAALLVLLAVVMASHAADPQHGLRPSLPPAAQATAALAAGVAIGIVASLLGVAGGELLIPTLVLLYAVDTKVAGTLSLAISLPTLLVSLARWRHARGDWSLWRANGGLLACMGAGSIAGAAGGARLLGSIDARALSLMLAALLAYSALHLAWQAHRA